MEKFFPISSSTQYFISDIIRHMESGSSLVAIYLDFSKAFESLNHDIFFRKLGRFQHLPVTLLASNRSRSSLSCSCYHTIGRLRHHWSTLFTPHYTNSGPATRCNQTSLFLSIMYSTTLANRSRCDELVSSN